LKLGKTSWFILVIGIFIVIVVSLGLARSQQMREYTRLSNELSVAEKRLSQVQVKQLTQQQEDLQGKLDASTVQLTAAKDTLRQTVQSIDVTDKFYAIVKSCGTAVSSYSSSNVKSDKVGDLSCSVITLNAVVEGDVSNLINLVIRLNTDFPTGLVNSAQISVPPSADMGKPSVNIVMVVYAYEGD
jgi:outer membrane murein-binding lipoprotein Lpp